MEYKNKNYPKKEFDEAFKFAKSCVSVTNLELKLSSVKICGYSDSEYLVMYFCKTCGIEQYFSVDSLPGGLEHCEYCEYCGGDLVEGS